MAAAGGKQVSFVKAAALILLAIFLYDVMGAIVKHLGDRYSGAQLSMFRNLFGLVPSATILAFSAAWVAASCGWMRVNNRA